jgi:hypothetical protein
LNLSPETSNPDIFVTLVAHDYSSKCLANNVQVNNKSYCENCDKLKSEHQITLDELKSAKLIIELLPAEINANIVSECACINSTNNIHDDKQDEAIKIDRSTS